VCVCVCVRIRDLGDSFFAFFRGVPELNLLLFQIPTQRAMGGERECV
jgi:hypothetical protein